MARKARVCGTALTTHRAEHRRCEFSPPCFGRGPRANANTLFCDDIFCAMAVRYGCALKPQVS